MKVLTILGSPRKNGVTSRMAKRFNQVAETSGASVKTYHLGSLSFQGCQGCNACKSTSEACVLKDDLTQVLDEMQSADMTVFATPVYYWDVSGQFKCFFDRTWSFVKPDYKTNPEPLRLEKGKTAVLITSQGDVEEKHKEVAEKYAGFLSMYGYHTHTIRAFGAGMEQDTPIEPFIDMAGEKAREIVTPKM